MQQEYVLIRSHKLSVAIQKNPVVFYEVASALVTTFIESTASCSLGSMRGRNNSSAPVAACSQGITPHCLSQKSLPQLLSQALHQCNAVFGCQRWNLVSDHLLLWLGCKQYTVQLSLPDRNSAGLCLLTWMETPCQKLAISVDFILL